MKKNRILTESQKKQILENKQKNIIENFSNVFNKIKRLNENELNNQEPTYYIDKYKDSIIKFNELKSPYNRDIDKAIKMAIQLLNDIYEDLKKHQLKIKNLEDKKDFNDVDGFDFNSWAYTQETQLKDMWHNLKKELNNLYFERDGLTTI
jgi:hypothetical protein